MPVIVIANPKGGVGKSTLATNLAGALACRGQSVALGDADRQQSSAQWLALRPAQLPTIRPWPLEDGHPVKPPKDVSYAVLDTPAGLHGKRLDEIMKLADRLLVPLQPSLFDIQATHAFLGDVLAHRRSERVTVGVIGMRLKEHTIAADQLRHFLGTLPVQVLGHVRDTQHYVQLAAHGLTLWDTAPSRVERDLEQWEPILAWATE